MGIDEVKDLTFNAILDHGHAVVLSPATERVPAPYAYTVGRYMKDRPEIVITGIEGEAATKLLNEICLVDDVIGLESGESFLVAGMQVRFIEAYTGHLDAAILQWQRPFRALQALLPDVAGEFPDTLRGRTSSQPLLPVIPEDAWDPYDEEDE
ncbi:hypothetical protein GCM10028801_31520 [Nocardioides maradonensis]